MNAPGDGSSRLRLFVDDDTPLLSGYQARARVDRPIETGADNSLLNSGFWVGAAEVPRSLPYIIKGVCAKAEIVVLWGEPAIGKSFLVADLCCCVGANVSWHGRPVAGGVVMYLVGESSRAAIETRIAALKREQPKVADAKVMVLPIALNLLRPGGEVDRLIAAAKDVARSVGEVVLIAIDTLAASFGGGDENSAADMGQFLDNMKQIIAETGAAVLLVHHCGKNHKAGMRGSSALLGRLDAELEILGKTDSGRVLRARKGRDRESNQNLFAFKLRIVEVGVDQDGDAITSCVIDVDESGTKSVRDAIRGNGSTKSAGKHQKVILSLLKAAGGRLPLTELARRARAASVPRNRAYGAITNLIKNGTLVELEDREVSLA